MWAQIEHKSDAIRCFHPAWFASVMGTGIIAVATHHADDVVPGLEGFAVVLWVLSRGSLCGSDCAVDDPLDPLSEGGVGRHRASHTRPVLLNDADRDVGPGGGLRGDRIDAHERRYRRQHRPGTVDRRDGAGVLLRRPGAIPVADRFSLARADQRRMVHPSGCQHRRSRRGRAADLLVGIAWRVRVRLALSRSPSSGSGSCCSSCSARC